MTKPRPDLSGNPFFAAGLVQAKKDWERKAEMCAQKNPLQNNLKGKFYLIQAVILRSYLHSHVFVRLGKPVLVFRLDRLSSAFLSIGRSIPEACPMRTLR